MYAMDDVPQTRMPRRRGLVLQGGGAKGAFQYGALKELYSAGFDFDVISGTSVGALNGALVSTIRVYGSNPFRQRCVSS
jgi:predicted acylesterase/phospholipase RssA